MDCNLTDQVGLRRIAPWAVRFRAPGLEDFGARVVRSSRPACPKNLPPMPTREAERPTPHGAIRVIRAIAVHLFSLTLAIHRMRRLEPPRLL